MLNISRNIYSGWNSTSKVHQLPEAEIIPIGESANEKRRMENVTKKYPTIKEYENIPLPGFTLLKADRKNWGSIDQTWLIIDPRGFLVRISNKNLEDILHVTGITEGLIQERCVWARENTETKMTLVPVSSNDYISAVENTELIEGKVSMKDVQIGDTVLLQNKLVGTYMGVASLYGALDQYSSSKKSGNKIRSYLRRQVIKVEDGKYHYQTNLKILKVIDKIDMPMSREDAIEDMNKAISLGNSFFTNTEKMSQGYYGSYGRINHVSRHAEASVKLTYEEISPIEAIAIFRDGLSRSDFGMLIVENDVGIKYLINFPFARGIMGCSHTSFQVCQIESIKNGEDNIVLTSERNWSGRDDPMYDINNFAKFYKILKHVRTETYI